MTKTDHDHQKETPIVLRPERSWIKLALLLLSSVASHSWKHGPKNQLLQDFIVVCCSMSPNLCHDTTFFLTGCEIRDTQFHLKTLKSSHRNKHFNPRMFQVPGVYYLQRINSSETKHIDKSQQKLLEGSDFTNPEWRCENHKRSKPFFRMSNYETRKQTSLKHIVTNIFKNADHFSLIPMP